MIPDSLASYLAVAAAGGFVKILGAQKEPLPFIARLLLSLPVLLACAWLFNQIGCLAVTSPTQWWQ